MKGVEVVIVMGIVYWICYYLAIALVVAVVGAIILGIIALIGAVYFFALVFTSLANRNFGGALALLAAPVILSGMSLLFVIAYQHGAFYFPALMADDSNPWSSILGIPAGLFALFGWLIPLFIGAAAAVEDSPLSSERTILSLGAIALTGVPWAFVGGSAWAGMAMGIHIQ